MGGIKQRLTYLESKVESLARRQNELELDRLNQNNLKREMPNDMVLQPSPAPIESFTVPKFDEKVYKSTVSYLDEPRPRLSDTEDDWSTALSFVQQEKFDLAYSLILKRKDDTLLFKLMGRTGVCFDSLNADNIESIIKVIAVTLRDKAFIDLLLPWVSSLCRRYDNLHPVVRSQYLTRALEDALFVLLTDTQDYLDQAQKDDVERMYTFIKAKNTRSSA